MTTARLTTALCTPLDSQDNIDEAALRAHLDDQIDHGIHGVLLGGSMGRMQLLTDRAYRRLIEVGVEHARGRMEIFVGAGDTSLPRTRERLAFLNTIDGIDGVAVLAPFFFRFSQSDLIRYFLALADVSRSPIFVYDLPQRTNTKVEIPTMLELAKHPNIVGAKCSDQFGATRELMIAIQEACPDFRLLVAQPPMLDMLVRHGVRDHLDGMWAIAPRWTMRVLEAVDAGDYETARIHTDKVTHLRVVMQRYPFQHATTIILNARGIPGRYHESTDALLTDAQRAGLLNEPIVTALLKEDKLQPLAA